MPAGVQLALVPLETLLVVVATGIVQALVRQAWKVRLPPVVAPRSAYVAVMLGTWMKRVPPPETVTVGTSGAVLSSVKPRAADQADWFPATSRPAARQ